MAKQRTKRTTVGIDLARDNDRTIATVVLFEVDTAAVMTVKDIESVDVTGAFVRYSPTVKASDLLVYSAEPAIEKLRERGARAVKFEPRIVPDEHHVREAEPEQVALPPEQAVDQWFERVVAKVEVKDAARSLVARFMSEEGL